MYDLPFCWRQKQLICLCAYSKVVALHESRDPRRFDVFCNWQIGPKVSCIDVATLGDAFCDDLGSHLAEKAGLKAPSSFVQTVEHRNNQVIKKFYVFWKVLELFRLCFDKVLYDTGFELRVEMMFKLFACWVDDGQLSYGCPFKCSR